MSVLNRGLLMSLLFFTTTLIYAETGYIEAAPASNPTSTDTLEEIKTYLAHLGFHFGYDLTTKTPETSPQNTLLTVEEGATTELKLLAQYTFFSFFGAIPVNTFLPTFIPASSTTNTIYEALNAFANSSFEGYEKPQHKPLSVSTLMDQHEYQKDPIDQATLNILSTPDYTFCMDNNAEKWKEGNCELLYENKVMSNIIGPLPSATQVFTYDYQKQFLSALNSNTLTGPLLYAKDTASNDTSSPSASNNEVGLVGKNQAEDAANFIRYATGAVTPLALISYKDYDTLQTRANSTTNDRTKRENAQAVLTNYLASVRVYAAQRSVATSNLYAILSKRLPQNKLGDTSQALNEMTMATRRLYDPANNATQWVDRINSATPATVQKEMALLLSEINYQLYLNRQQDERILLTNTMLLIYNLSQHKPTAEMSQVESNP